MRVPHSGKTESFPEITWLQWLCFYKTRYQKHHRFKCVLVLRVSVL